MQEHKKNRGYKMQMRWKNRLSFLVGVAGLALWISACTTPVLGVQETRLTDTPIQPIRTAPTPTAVVMRPTYTPIEPTHTPEGPTQPAPTYTAIQPDGSRFLYEGVHFLLDLVVASGARGRVVPENAGSPEGPYWEIHPEYIDISLVGYPLAQTSFTPVISVYPLESYRKLSPRAGEIIDRLQNTLAQKPADSPQIPFLPIWNAGQVFHSNVQYLDFQNGKGVRFLTIYAQYPAPVNNKDLLYTFQGLTSDGRYYVSIILPVNHSSLPANSDAVSQDEMEANIKNPNYYPDFAANLSAQPANSFTPDLASLDVLIASLQIER